LKYPIQEVLADPKIRGGVEDCFKEIPQSDKEHAYKVEDEDGLANLGSRCYEE
jgi:hypothetical protein